VYDGTTDATLNFAGSALAGVISGDAVTLNPSGATGKFASKDVGNNLTVTVSGLTLGGIQAGNYALPPSPAATPGGWSQFQGNAAHSGAVADTVDPTSLAPTWT